MCRGVIKAQRQLIKPMKKQKNNSFTSKKNEEKLWNIPKLNFDPPRPLTNEEIKESSQTQCFRPDVYLSNGRHCEGCEYFELCTNELKCMPKHLKKRQPSKH